MDRRNSSQSLISTSVLASLPGWADAALDHRYCSALLDGDDPGVMTSKLIYAKLMRLLPPTLARYAITCSVRYTIMAEQIHQTYENGREVVRYFADEA